MSIVALWVFIVYYCIMHASSLLVYLYDQEAVAKGTLQIPSSTMKPSSLNPKNPSTVRDSPPTISSSRYSFLLNAENDIADCLGLGSATLESRYMY
jgi:hypothetical protein